MSILDLFLYSRDNPAWTLEESETRAFRRTAYISLRSEVCAFVLHKLFVFSCFLFLARSFELPPKMIRPRQYHFIVSIWFCPGWEWNTRTRVATFKCGSESFWLRVCVCLYFRYVCKEVCVFLCYCVCCGDESK